VVTTPLTLDLAVGGTAADTAITVGVGAQGLAGPVTLHLSLPAGVSLTGATGDWTSCSQSGTTVTCSAAWRRDGRWSGTLHTRWSATARGELTATVTGRYANGSAGTADARTTWPP
jgi:hypothetical protein